MGRERQKAKSEAAKSRALEAALELFSRQGFRGTSMREIADAADASMGNVYYHFPSKEAIFEHLLGIFWERVLDADLPLNQVFERGGFPDDLEEIAAGVEGLVEDNLRYFLLVYVDVIEFQGEHIRAFFLDSAARVRGFYGEALEQRRQDGTLGEADPGFAAVLAVRWLVYYFIVEKCFGVPDHMGMPTGDALRELFRLLRRGLDPRD